MSSLTRIWEGVESGDDPSEGPATPSNPKKAGKRVKRTFAQAQQEIWKLLSDRGWKDSGPLKIRHFTSPRGEFRLWFKTQAVYYTTARDRGNRHEFGSAYSFTYFDSIKDVTAEEFLAQVENYMRRNKVEDISGMTSSTKSKFRRPSRMEGKMRSNALELAKSAYRKIVRLMGSQDTSDVRQVLELLANCANGDDYAEDLVSLVQGLTQAEADALGDMAASSVFDSLVQKLESQLESNSYSTKQMLSKSSSLVEDLWRAPLVTKPSRSE